MFQSAKGQIAKLAKLMEDGEKQLIQTVKFKDIGTWIDRLILIGFVFPPEKDDYDDLVWRADDTD